MNPPLALASIPESEYSDYRYQVIFNAYKWDPQVYDHNTVARQVILMSLETAQELESLAEQLAAETVQMEEALIGRPELIKQLSFGQGINRALRKLGGYRREDHVRLMRFDFHPTETGWAVSEVNSDVPGGFAEASVLPGIAAPYFPGYTPRKNAVHSLYNAFKSRLPANGTVAFVHATSYADDRQVMQCIGDYFSAQGLTTLMAAPDHIRWDAQKAVSICSGAEGPVDGIVRFFPLEWLGFLPKKTSWRGYYNTQTPSCNHPMAMLAQSKRLPLVWDMLGVDIPAWKSLLPETADPRTLKTKRPDDNWIYKPALGRVGEGITIREALTSKELTKIYKAVKRRPKDWVAQKMFRSRPLADESGKEYHLCVGVFTIDGKCAGFYGRISPHRRIDDKARDIPILVKGEQA